MALAILILAAGSSTRMGQPKQLLPWSGTTLLRHAIRQAWALNANITVVLGAHHDTIRDHLADLQVNTAHNRAFTSGLGASIAVGVASLLAGDQEYEAVLIMLADQPSVDTLYLSSIVDAHLALPDNVIATQYVDKVGVPALFPAAYFPALRALGGDAGAGAFLNTMNSGIHLLTPPQPIFDIDTPEDYRRHEGDS